MRDAVSDRAGGGRLGRTSGQAMTEALIMLSLFGFVWLMATYTTFYMQNGIRAAMASRHGAWMRAQTPTADRIDVLDAVDFEFRLDQDIAVVRLPPVSEPITLPGVFAGFDSVATSEAYFVESVEVGFDVTMGPSRAAYYGRTITFPLMGESLASASGSPSGLSDLYETTTWPTLPVVFHERAKLWDYAKMLGL